MRNFSVRLFIIAMAVVLSVFGISAGFDDTYAVSRVSDINEVYLGGYPLGVDIGTEGVIIMGVGNVVTDKGLASPLKNADIKCGDILLAINENSVKKPSDITEILSKSKSKEVRIKVKRGENTFEEKATVVYDALTREKRLGLSVKENISGVGTLTFITDDKRFGALGHHITDPETGMTSQLNEGKIYECSIVGVVKGVNGRAGELRGAYNRYGKPIGYIDNNNSFGIFGQYDADISGFEKKQVASASEIKHGKAYIYTTIDGKTPEYYTIDIIKTNNQQSPEVKSMVISVTDNRLIEKCGGIVQGMSGSPIIQNGKIVGAVTHVFVNDATKGYGVYIDWMLDNSHKI